MDKWAMIEKTKEYVKGRLDDEATGHDWFHVMRVWKLARRIGEKEDAELFIVQLAALLHDLDDWKIKGDHEGGAREAREWLESIHVEEKTADHVCDIIERMSFRGAGVETPMKTLEGKVVQDADRLDAIGAVGIARAFTYGGKKGFGMHDPSIKPKLHNSFEEYRGSKSTTINHFYEKLLLLKDRMNTTTGKQIAAERHAFLEAFIQHFLSEWDG